MSIKEVIRTLFLIIGRILNNNRKSRVLYYHDVSNSDGNSYTPMSTPFDVFVSHINILQQYGDVVPHINSNIGQFQIAFDDGFLGVYDNKEFFIERNIFPTVFVAKKLVGMDGYMNEKQIKELSDLGFNIQSHTISHLDLTSFDDKDLTTELLGSKEYLEILLNKCVDEICCPIGYYNDEVIEKAKNVGYKKIYLSYPSPANVEDFVVGRYLCQSLSLTQFKLVLRGGADIFKSRYINLHRREKV